MAKTNTRVKAGNPLLAKPNLYDRAKNLRLWGILAHWEEYVDESWLAALITREEEERQRRTIEARIKGAHVGRFKSMADFDWEWPKKIDREHVEDLFTLRFIDEGANAVLAGPNGVGKTMIMQNIVHHAAVRGHTSLFTTASKVLNDLAQLDTASARERRIRKYCRPQLLAMDELGYLSYDNLHVDLLFEIISRRYEEKSILISTNRPFQEWNEIFPNSSCVGTLIDRFTHHCEIIKIEGDSYRKKEAQERADKGRKERQARRKKRKGPSRLLLSFFLYATSGSNIISSPL